MSYQREFSHRLRAGLVGIGSHAYRNILPVMNFLPVQLVAVCNRSNIELAQLTAAQYGCKSYQKPEEMYEKEYTNFDKELSLYSIKALDEAALSE